MGAKSCSSSLVRSGETDRVALLLRSVVSDDLPALAAFAARAQQRVDRHVAYLGTEPASLVAEIGESTWSRVGVVAERADQLAGWLIGDIDEEMGRVWWLGPFIADGAVWATVATDLLHEARVRLPDSISEEELAVDDRATEIIDWAIAAGFDRDPGSHVMTLNGPTAPPSQPVREIEPRDHVAVVALHDGLFAGTHTPGRQLIDGHDESHRRLVLEIGGAVVGYIAVERTPDGTGYIDYLGVDADARGRGYGAELVRAGVAELDRIGAVGAHLTVREQAPGVRDLYRSLGFVIERTIVPLRRGFRLP